MSIIDREFPPTASGLHCVGKRRSNFLAKISIVDDETSCWTWTASKRNRRGYGQFGIYEGQRKRVAFAHRVALEMSTGVSIPPGMFALHRCGNGHLGCVRPSHLYAGTAKQNSEDMVAHGRSVRGERSPRSKLTEAVAREAMRLLVDGETFSAVARRLSVSRPLLYAVVHGDSWPHIERPPELKALAERVRASGARMCASSAVATA